MITVTTLAEMKRLVADGKYKVVAVDIEETTVTHAMVNGARIQSKPKTTTRPKAWVLKEA